MRYLTRLALLAGLLVFALPSPVPASSLSLHGLSARDRATAVTISHLAARKPTGALAWARHQAVVASATFGPARGTIVLRFRDGHPLIVLLGNHPASRLSKGRPLAGLLALRAQPLATAHDGTAPRAAVLLPFESELGNNGQAEIDALTKAGFQVDVFHDADVSIGLMEHLSDYSVVYMETHSDPLPGGDAIVATGSTDSTPYKAFMPPAYVPGGDGTITPVIVSGQSQLYLAITAGFVTNHMGTFPGSSLVYLDGCDLLNTDVFWHALENKGVETMIAWDNHVYPYTNESSAAAMFAQLASGSTVAGSLQAVQQEGLGTGAADLGPTHLGFQGDGNDTFALALAETKPTATPTLTATATLTPTPRPTKTPVKKSTKKKKPSTKKKSACKPGHHRVHGKCVLIRKKHKK